MNSLTFPVYNILFKRKVVQFAIILRTFLLADRMFYCKFKELRSTGVFLHACGTLIIKHMWWAVTLGKVFNSVSFPPYCVWLLRVADPPRPTGSSQFTRRVINLVVIASCKSPVYNVVSANLVCNRLINS